MKQIFIVALVLVTFSCTSVKLDSSYYDNKIKVACVGDSITYGLGIKKRRVNSYPSVLQSKLGDNYAIHNFGVSGATLLRSGNKPYWKTKKYKKALSFNPDIVIIKLGTNDSKRKNWKRREDFLDNYTDLIDSFISVNSSVKIYVCLPAPAFPGKSGIRNSVIKNEIIPLIELLDIDKIDIFSNLEDKGWLFPDKVHPSKDGAYAIAEIIYDALK